MCKEETVSNAIKKTVITLRVACKEETLLYMKKKNDTIAWCIYKSEPTLICGSVRRHDCFAVTRVYENGA